jgi:hypothetical protein
MLTRSISCWRISSARAASFKSIPSRRSWSRAHVRPAACSPDVVAADMKIGKPLPSSIATLSLEPEGPVLTESASYQQHFASTLLHDSKTVCVAHSGESTEDKNTEARHLIEANDDRLEGYRQPGELALYVMFVKVSGRFGLLVFVFLLAIFVVGITYPRESPLMIGFVQEADRHRHGRNLLTDLGLTDSSRSAQQYWHPYGPLLGFERSGLVRILGSLRTIHTGNRTTHFYHISHIASQSAAFVSCHNCSSPFASSTDSIYCSAPLSFLATTDRGSITNRYYHHVCIKS